MNWFGFATFSAAVALVATACAASPDDVGDAEPPATPPSSSESAAPSSTATTESAEVPTGPSALTEPRSDVFPPPLVPIDEIISGGPPPDGIPSLDAPILVEVAAVSDQLEPAESVVALEINGDARAYPVRVMIWHEIVNDTVGGVPVSVTYCPLCNSAVSYRREVNGVETTFGTSGSLYASALVMYDRLTESLWTHFDGRAVVGVLAGAQLEPLASPLMAWEDFVATYPDGQVLDWTQTGHSRDYGRNPYVGYDDADTEPFLFRGIVDDRERAKQRVVGITVDEASVAYSMALLADGNGSATAVTVGDRDLVILWEPGQASALDASTVEGGKDVGSVGVFAAELAGSPVTLAAQDGRFIDDETGSTWTIAGIAVEGPLKGSRLERVEHLDTFWFAWSTYRPDTLLIEG
ncbi:MAG: DUF3179 domain-containing protein [Acidimicrobiia bacterium]